MKYFLPKTFESIEEIFAHSELNVILTNEKENVDLTWYLLLFTKLVRARGDVLLAHKQLIFSLFQKCLPIVNKTSYGIVAQAAKALLESLTQLYPNDYRLTIETVDRSFEDFLPIRVSGCFLLRSIFSL